MASALACSLAALPAASFGATDIHHLIAGENILEVAVSAHPDGSSTLAWILQEPDLDHLL